MTSESAPTALDLALGIASPALGSEPAGVCTDMDGTLAPIVGEPGAVRLADGAAAALARLAARIAVVAIVTGRAATDARRIAGLQELAIAGNHGTEWLAPHAVEPEPDPRHAMIAADLDRVLASLPAIDGVEREHKGISATVHYRNAVEPRDARERLVAALAAAMPDDVGMRHGRMSIELRPTGLGDKGTAVRAIVDRYRLRGLVVLGDDVTDLDMFRAAAELRREGALRAAIIAVGSDGEVPEEVHAAADAVLDDQAQVVELLQALVG